MAEPRQRPLGRMALLLVLVVLAMTAALAAYAMSVKLRNLPIVSPPPEEGGPDPTQRLSSDLTSSMSDGRTRTAISSQRSLTGTRRAPFRRSPDPRCPVPLAANRAVVPAARAVPGTASWEPSRAR